jgi:hypothetical protein
MKTMIEPTDFTIGKPGGDPFGAERPNGKIVRHKNGECKLIVIRGDYVSLGETKRFGFASLIDGLVFGWYTAEEMTTKINGDDYHLVWPMQVKEGIHVTPNTVFGGRS